MAERKVILISGASRGIGRAIAERLLKENYALSLGLRNPEDLAGTELAPSDQVLLCPYEAMDQGTGHHWVELNMLASIRSLIERESFPIIWVQQCHTHLDHLLSAA